MSGPSKVKNTFANAYVIANGTVGIEFPALSSTAPNAGFALREPDIAPAITATLL
ncbi:hypothetical protein D3C85_1882380 [compost metagenome]